MKTCSKCNKEKAITEFHKCAKTKDGLQYACKECGNAFGKEWYRANKVRAKETRGHWAKDNRERHNELNRAWMERNPEYRERKNEGKKHYRETHVDEIREYRRKWERATDSEWREKINAYRRDRNKNDVIHNMRTRLHNLTYHAFNSHGYKDRSLTASLLGCSYSELVKHIDNQFTDGMSWENRSEWHIDHIVPLASAKSKIELEQLCLYTNLQPLWAADNMAKGDRVI